MFLSVSNYIFTVIFVGEMMIKVTITVLITALIKGFPSKTIFLHIRRQFCFCVEIREDFCLNFPLKLLYYFDQTPSNKLCFDESVCVFMWFGVIRLLLWDCTLERECTCRAAGTSWTVC